MKKMTVIVTVFILSLVYGLGDGVRAESKGTVNTDRQIERSLRNLDTTGYYDTTELNYKEVGNTIKAVLRKTPELSHVKNWVAYGDGKIEYNYTDSAKDIQNKRKIVEDKSSKVVKEIQKTNKTDFDKVRAVHDYVILNTEYDYDNWKKNKAPADSYSAYGVYGKGIAVCDGYTKAVQVLLNKLGIENEYVLGYLKNGDLHAWNMVKVDGKYYHMDTTMDDPVQRDKSYNQYDYFLVDSETMSKTHIWDKEGQKKADSKKYGYFKNIIKTEVGQVVVEKGNYLYYGNKKDQDKWYKISKDGKGNQRVGNVRVPYYVYVNGWVYFSNYTDNGYLYKMKIDGGDKKLIKKVRVDWISEKSGKVIYKVKGKNEVTSL